VLCQAKFPEKTARHSGKRRGEFPTFTAGFSLLKEGGSGDASNRSPPPFMRHVG